MKTIVILLLCMCCAVMASAGVGDRHAEKEGKFSWCAPKGWIFLEVPSLKYRVSLATKKEGGKFSANICVVDEAYKGTLSSYVDANIATMKKHISDFTLLKREKFTTTNGTQGERFLMTRTQSGNLLRQMLYMFDRQDGRMFVVTCTTLADKGEAYDAVFEESLKTFEFTK